MISTVRVCDECKKKLASNSNIPKNPDEMLIRRLSLSGTSEVMHGEHFAVLGIPPTSDIAKVKKAYMKLAQKLHPDKAKAAGKTHELCCKYF
jgi:DnaJ-domain-containing protein 1